MSQDNPESLKASEKDEDIPNEQLFALARGAYDEEGSGKVVPWQELSKSEISTGQLDTGLAISGLGAEAETRKYKKRHELALIRDRFERQFTTWIPFSQAEMTLAVTGLTTTANKIISKISPNTLPATESYYKAAISYRNQASIHHVNLLDAKVLDQDLRPSLDKIRQTPEIRESLADYLYARQSLERLKWGQKRGKRQSQGKMPREREYQEIYDSIGVKSDEALIAVWERALQCSYSRKDFWQRELDNTEDSNELVRAIKSEDISRRT